LSSYQIIFIPIFWLAALFLFQTYIGTLLSLLLANLFRHKSPTVERDPAWELPSVTVLVPARNEEKVIVEKIDNLLAQDYPDDRMEIYVVSDCSTDKTVDIVRNYADRGVKLIEFVERHGKLGIIDEVIPGLSGEIIVITDANVALASDAIKSMMEEYADSAVGAVDSDLQRVIPSEGKNLQGEVIYRQYENMLKRLMGKFGAVIGVLGGFYSQRRSLFRPLGRLPMHDDVILPHEVLAQGYKVVHSEQAGAVEKTEPTIAAEYIRRVRMAAFNLNTIPRMMKLSWKAGPKVFYLTLSYKLFRWLSPYLFALLFILSLALIGTSLIYNVVALAFGFSLILSGIGWIKDKSGRKGGITTGFYHFTAMNVAAFAGIGVWLKGVKKYWEPRGL